LPLSPESVKKFNNTAAWQFFKKTEGLPYGFHNLFTGWIDTASGNYPPPLTSPLAMLVMSFGEVLLPMIVGESLKTFDFLAQTFNHRLGTTNLTLNQVYAEAGKRGLVFDDVAVMPELDSWTFVDDNQVGPSMVCDVFVMRIWKAGGMFGNLTDLIQAGEFTNPDAYTLKIFDSNYQRPAQCVAADPDSQFCQLLGEYRMVLRGYNTAMPFAHMRENCPGLPPLYQRPANC